jgi:23S rRNA (cytosine1962-C5)-methyltransferase
MADYQTLFNRLSKNLKLRQKMAKTLHTSAWRLYHKDIPEFPYIIDYYAGHFVVWEKGKSTKNDEIYEKSVRNHEWIEQALKELMQKKDLVTVFKTRTIQTRETQYNKEDSTNHYITVDEGELKFFLNLYDYLDVGLFLDHRPLRQRLLKDAKDKKVLNLFCYTGSLSVASAKAGAKVTSVDMSNTYLKWAEDNFLLNKLSVSQNSFIRADINEFLKTHFEKYDLILLDPPSFSTSKKMHDVFDVQRDHVWMIERCMNLLNPGGMLIFSNNLRTFKLDASVNSKYNIKDITKWSIPQDISDAKIHVCFEIRAKS